MSDIKNLQKYTAKTTSIEVNMTYGKNTYEGFNYYLNGGLMYCFAEDSAPMNEDASLSYGIGGSYSKSHVSITGEVIGILNMTTDEVDSFKDRYINAANFGAFYTKGAFKPGIFYSIYMEEEYRDMASGILGIKLSYSIAQ